ncbi:MAG: DKNYY domain-containing protein [Tannerella sp.]|jgi:hypothetical protein|nr:DKNYY domain-containing protein [Tannerella sp.]
MLVVLLRIIIFIKITTDIESYKIFSTAGHYKDQNHVYWAFEIIPGADPSTYDYVKTFWGYADDTHVFYKGLMVKDADPESMERINYDFTKDKRHVYRRWKIIEGVDPTHFGQLKDYKYYYTDGEKIYYCEDNEYNEFFEVKGADINTFRYDSRSKRYKDRHGTYYAGQKIS